MVDIKINDLPIHIMDCIQSVSSDQAGALATFTGTVRANTDGRKVLKLIYESYPAMAEIEIKKIAVAAQRNYKIDSISIHHRIGTLQVGDIAVNIVVSAAHRTPALNACAFIIEKLKQTVPIWKKEIFEDGDQWVSAHP